MDKILLKCYPGGTSLVQSMQHNSWSGGFEFKPHIRHEIICLKKGKKIFGSAQLAQWVGHLTLDIRVVSLSPTSGSEFT